MADKEIKTSQLACICDLIIPYRIIRIAAINTTQQSTLKVSQILLKNMGNLTRVKYFSQRNTEVNPHKNHELLASITTASQRLCLRILEYHSC